VVSYASMFKQPFAAVASTVGEPGTLKVIKGQALLRGLMESSGNSLNTQLIRLCRYFCIE